MFTVFFFLLGMAYISVPRVYNLYELYSVYIPVPVYNSVAEPKLFIFGSDSGSNFCHILTLIITVVLYYNSSVIRNMYQWMFFFILASSKRTCSK